MSARRLLWAVLLLVGCGPVPAVLDAGGGDAGSVDAGREPDAGSPHDAGPELDAGAPDASVPDAAVPDAGVIDAGTPDAGPVDAGRDCTPVVLDLDTPLSTTPPPYTTRTGQQSPTAFWGTVPAPRPTNAAWQNFVLGPGQNRVDFLPYQLKALPEGLAVALATPVNTLSSIDVPDRKQLVLTSLQSFTSHALDAWDTFSVTMTWRAPGGTMTAPMVFGMPYVTVDYVGLRPFILPGTFTIASVNGQANPGAATGSRFELVLSDGSTWIVYASGALTFDWNRGTMTARTAFTGTLRAASLQRAADATILDAHADTVPRGGHLEATVSCDVATLRFVFTTTGTSALLMNALPHHVARLNVPALVNLEYPTLSGTLRGVEGSTWSMTVPLTTIAWSAPRAVAPGYLGAVKSALAVDATVTPDANTVANDPYFGGKLLARLARLALIADEVGEPATAASVRARLGPLVGAWLDGTNSNPLVFDSTWGGVVTTSSLSDPNAQFGSGHYNDHHFHWGYHLYAAAAMAHGDATFATTHRQGLLSMVRDIANPSGADPHFPRFRSMDFFRGHSWAAGLSEFGDGQNQESSSEAINAWYGMALLGEAMSDQRIKDLGRLLLTLEVDAAQTYWQLPNPSPLYGYPFKANHAVGILFQTRAFFGTFFAAGPQFVYGIQLLPFTPISEAFVSRTWVGDSWADMSAAASVATPGWQGFLYLAHAVTDRSAAWTEVNSLTGWDDGNSKTNALWWVATRPGP